MRGSSGASAAWKRGNPSRLYAIESAPSVSGSLADHHFAVKSGESLPDRLSACEGLRRRRRRRAGTAAPDWLSVVADDLQQSKGRSVVIPGEFQPESVHLAAYAMNAALGNVGQTVYGCSKESSRTIPTRSKN